MNVDFLLDEIDRTVEVTPFSAAAQWCLDVLGIPSGVCDASDRIQWDGVEFRGTCGSDIIHEAAHFIVASNERKMTIGFGLGDEPEVMPCADRSVTYAAATAEEGLASFFGILIERSIHFDFSETLVDHGWVWSDNIDGKTSFAWDAADYESSADILFGAGFVDKNMFPIIENIRKECADACCEVEEAGRHQVVP